MFVILYKYRDNGFIHLLTDQHGTVLQWTELQHAVDYGEGKEGVPALILTASEWCVFHLDTVWALSAGRRYRCGRGASGALERDTYLQG